MKIDMNFIAEMEGSVSKGYVPARNGVPIGQSGVTVGVGVDLGQRSEAELARMGVPGGVLMRLLPYLGLRKGAAQDALRARPLVLSDEEAMALSAAVAGEIFGRLAIRYAKAAGVDFASLPAPAQTAIASVAYQYGDNLPARTPNFWRIITRQDWPAAVRALENFGDGYAKRRKHEANIMRGAVV